MQYFFESPKESLFFMLIVSELIQILPKMQILCLPILFLGQYRPFSNIAVLIDVTTELIYVYNDRKSHII